MVRFAAIVVATACALCTASAHAQLNSNFPQPPRPPADIPNRPGDFFPARPPPPFQNEPPPQQAGPQPANTAPQPDDTVVTEMPTQKIPNERAVFTGLDKITGRIINFDAAINETV